MKKIEIIFALLIAGIIINMTYLDIGFNEFLSKESISSDILTTDPFYSETEGGRIQQGINADNITVGQMSFDRAQGGTLTLGGQGNINGKFILADNSNNEKITMDKDGMVIKDGSITVKNSNNQSVLDADGLVSANNFLSGGVTSIGDTLTTANVWTDINNLSLKIKLSRPTYVLLMAGGNFTFPKLDLDGVNVGYIESAFKIDGTIPDFPHSSIFTVYNEFKITNIFYEFSSFQYLILLPAGIHDIKLDWRLTQITGTPSANCLQLYLNYLVLGS